MPIRKIVAVLLGSSLAWPLVGHAQQPWIDAGQQAMIQHYNNLIEQQSAPDQEEAAERARKARGSDEMSPDERCDAEAVKAKLRPEFERRLRSDGNAAATAWLRQKGAEAGRYAAQNC